MSKYVRTDEGIIYVGDLIKDEYGNYCYKETYETDMEVNGEYIIKEADTIEELCDGFYINWENRFSPNNFYTNYQRAKEYWLDYVVDCKYDNEEIDLFCKGFIETDKGLIYVAKLNEKGEVELL